MEGRKRNREDGGRPRINRSLPCFPATPRPCPWPLRLAPPATRRHLTPLHRPPFTLLLAATLSTLYLHRRARVVTQAQTCRPDTDSSSPLPLLFALLFSSPTLHFFVSSFSVSFPRSSSSACTFFFSLRLRLPLTLCHSQAVLLSSLPRPPARSRAKRAAQSRSVA